MSRILPSIALLALASLLGCGLPSSRAKFFSLNSVPVHEPIDAARLAQDGVLFVSLAGPTLCWKDELLVNFVKSDHLTRLNISNDLSGAYELRNMQPADKQVLATLRLNNPAIVPDIAEGWVSVLAIAMPAGSYHVLIERSAGMYAKPILRDPVEIRPGKLTYIGSLEVVGCESLKLKFADMWSRDSTKIAELYPHLPLGGALKDVRPPKSVVLDAPYPK
jgi:hypothetical protein